MKRKLPTFISCTLLLGLVLNMTAVIGQVRHELDLGSNITVNQKYTPANTPTKVIITNLDPTATYNLKIELKDIEYGKLDGSLLDTKKEKRNGNDDDTPPKIEENNLTTIFQSKKDLIENYNKACSQLKEEGSNSEKDIHSVVETLENLKGKIADNKKAEVENFIAKTRIETLAEYTLLPDQELTISVSKIVDNEVKKEWKLILKTKTRGNWQVTYGAAYIIDEINKEEIFTSRFNSTDNNYILTKTSENKSLNYAGTIFFSWMPTLGLKRDLTLSLSAGVGFNQESPMFLLGPTLSYNQNLKVHIGLVGHEQQFLKNRYYEGQVVNENLGEDDLHTEKYTFNPFVSITLRFDKNPFKTD